MKKVILLLILFSTISYSQNIQTKFIRKGNLNDLHSDQLHQFKKNDVVYLIKRLDDNRWQVNTKGHTGYVASQYLKLTNEIVAIIEQYEQKAQKLKDENERIRVNDSIDSVRRRKILDSIKNYEAMFKLKRDDSIKKNIVQYAADSLLIIKTKDFTKMYPKLKSTDYEQVGKYEDIYILNYSRDYYKVYVKGLGSGYIHWSELYQQYGKNSQYAQYQLARALIKIKETDENKIDLAKQKADLVNRKADLVKRENDYIKRFGQSTYNKLKKGYYWIGMTDEMAKIAGYYPGRSKVNKSVGSWGVHEQWVCGNNLFLYFKNGILTSYQN